MLTPTSYGSAEPTTPGGGGEGGAVGGGAAPLRYGYTGRGRLTFSPWDDPLYEYSLGQHQMGSNSLSKLEVVSSLNCLNIGYYMYHYNTINCTEKYAPKIYINASITVAEGWTWDLNNYVETTLPNWPQNFGQVSQKGEAYMIY